MRKPEGGSDAADIDRRLSADGDHVINRRPSFKSTTPRTPPLPRPPKGCCGFGTEMAEEEVDYALIGGGIMSATLGLLLKQLQPSWKINIYERLGSVAQESSNGWNNAGTGHSALCEPNYTPWKEGSKTEVDITKAITVCENWWLSRQYWSYLVEQGEIDAPNKFINNTPHMTVGRGEEQVRWLKTRYEALSKHPLFEGMEYSEDDKKMAQWCQIMIQGRQEEQKVAMTRCDWGTDVDFGALTEDLVKVFMKKGGNLLLYHTVTNLKKLKDSGEFHWLLTVQKKDCYTGLTAVKAKYVFCGAGGWALPLLQKSGIPEIRGFMGFPISGEFLVCQNPDIVSKQGNNKVYGPADVGAPPMSVPHLDARIIGGKRMLLFGPFAGFSPRYLKTGSLMDLICAVRCGNLFPAACAGLRNLDLTVYLAKQLLKTNHGKHEILRDFIPDAKPYDWTLVTAGQRVQIMKKDAKKGGILQFGTEVVSSADGSISGLLGASPGASTAVQVALDVLKKTRKEKIKEWEPEIAKMIASYGTKLADDKETYRKIKARTGNALRIK
jgi:malate dehydrogenase (quinone)